MNIGHLIICVFITGLTVTSCNVNQNKAPENKVNDSASINLPKKTEEVGSKHKIIHYDLFNTDSIIGSYHILCKSQENGKIVTTYPITDGKGKDTICYAGQDVVLTVTKDGKDVVLNRKIQIDDFRSFIPKKEIVNYILTNFSIKEVMINKITFDIGYSIPETDIYYSFELILLDNGSLKIKEVIEEESDM